jgi:hypothetical protein
MAKVTYMWLKEKVAALRIWRAVLYRMPRKTHLLQRWDIRG